MSSLEWLLEHKLIAILRGVAPGNIQPVVEALFQGGIRVLEITLNSEDAFNQIRKLSNLYNDRLLIGAGTVLNIAGAQEAKDAGAKFLISPGLVEEVVSFTKKNQLVSIPGAYTPTEILHAHNAGADIVKIFPVSDAAYLKSVAAPLDHVRMMPTGGINTGNINDFRNAGAVAYGIGSSLVAKSEDVNDDYLAGIRSRAEAFVQTVARF